MTDFDTLQGRRQLVAGKWNKHDMPDCFRGDELLSFWVVSTPLQALRKLVSSLGEHVVNGVFSCPVSDLLPLINRLAASKS